jgi:hypothetical protein
LIAATDLASTHIANSDHLSLVIQERILLVEGALGSDDEVEIEPIVRWTEVQGNESDILVQRRLFILHSIPEANIIFQIHALGQILEGTLDPGPLRRAADLSERIDY